jgi:putative membrane protein
VPALALGVPDASMAATALPGHRLVLGGRGREALRLSALGSGLALAVAVPLAVPVTAAMRTLYPVLRRHLPVVLALVGVALVLTEPSWRARAGGAFSLALASALGVVALDISPAAPLAAGGVLTPLFAGLFGAPVLVEAMDGGGVPAQDDANVATAPRSVGVASAAGAAAGGLVGYLPGVSSAVAAVLVLPVLPGDGGDRRYVVATSGVNTANAVFALFALSAFGAPRTGVMVAFDGVGAPVVLPVLVAVVVLAGVWGTLGVLLVGDAYLRVVGSLDYRRVSLAVGALLVALSALFAGVAGVVVFAVSVLVGLVPLALGVKRVHLMGVLLGPLALGV